MVTVTYRQLIPMDADYPGVSSQIETFTGSRVVYGLDTPINVLDIIDHVSLSVGLLALEYANVEMLCQTLAVAVIRGNMDPWFAGDTRLSSFLNDTETYLNTKTTPATPRLDSCGDPVPGFYGVIPVSRLTDELAAIEVSSNALDLTAGTTYEQSYWLLQPTPYTPDQIAYWQAQALIGGYIVDLTGVNTIDPVNDTAQPIPDYPTQNVTPALSNDPNTFFNDSATFDAQTPAGTQYGLLIHQPINQSDAPPVNYTNTSIQMLVDAVSQTITMITQNINLLPDIVSMVQNYMLQYATQQRLELGPEISRLNEIGITGIFPMSTNDPNNAANEQAIINTGLNERSALLHDSAYISSFGSGGEISGVQRAAMEQDVRSQMKTVRLSTAQSLLASTQAQYDALAGLYSDARIVSIVTPYLL